MKLFPGVQGQNEKNETIRKKRKEGVAGKTS